MMAFISFYALESYGQIDSVSNAGKSLQFTQSIEKIDSTIKNVADSLLLKSSLINDLKASIQTSSQKIKQLNTQINILKNKKEKSQAESQELQEKTDSLNITINTKVQQSNSLDSLIKSKHEVNIKLDSAIDKKNKTVDSLKGQVDTLKAQQDKQQKTLNSQQTLISKQLDSLEVIAKIEMKDTLLIFNDTMKDFKKVRTSISQVNITVREGIILEIIVRTKDGIFRNRNAIIDLLHFGERGKNDRLYIERQDYHLTKLYDYSYIYLGDVIKYSVIRSYSDVAYGDFDIALYPNDTTRTYLLRESTSINTYFNVAAFTDIKGINGEPNGLAQFTADAKFITRTKNFANTALVAFNYLSFHGALSKFDNDFKGSELYNNDSVSRKELLQRSTYSVGVKFNILRGFSSPRPRHLFSDLQLNIGYNFLGSKVFDTLLKANTVIDTAFKTVTQNQLYFEPTVTINRRRNFSITMSVPIYLVSVKKSALLSNNDWESWIKPSISLMYFGKNDPASKIFFRYNHYINLKNATQAFVQMQLGFAVNLTEVWSNK